jgi:hypothetical protein
MIPNTHVIYLVDNALTTRTRIGPLRGSADLWGKPIIFIHFYLSQRRDHIWSHYSYKGATMSTR